MSYVFVLPREIIERLYTQCCDCFDFTKAITDLEAVKKEDNIDKAITATFKFVSTYVKNIVLHTGRLPLLQHKTCREKEFVLSNNLTTVLKLHIEFLKLVETILEREKARKFHIIIPPHQSDLLEVFGSPNLAKSIELHHYIDLAKTFLEGALKFYSAIAKTFTPAAPNILVGHLKFIVLTLRIFASYRVKNNSDGKLPIYYNGSIELELHADTPI
jgi:hypothetical protein